MLIFSCTSVRGDGDAAPCAREYSAELQIAIDGAGGAAGDIDGAAQSLGEQSAELVSDLERAESESAGLADDLRGATEELDGIVRGLDEDEAISRALDDLIEAIREQLVE